MSELFSTIKISGPDARNFLQRLTTQDFRSVPEGALVPAAVLNPNSSLVSMFHVQTGQNAFSLILERRLIDSTFDFFDRFHFAENLHLEKVSLTEKPAILGLEASSERELDEILTRYRRFRFGRDITSENLILEAPMSEYLSKDKGCYPGQEVVERVFTYGQVAKKLMGFEIESPIPENEKLVLDKKEVGWVTSAHWFESDRRGFAFAMIKKPAYAPGQLLQLSISNKEISLVELPGHF